jgi:C4-dicarboxylate-specific signal transduction histidine kinase
MLASRMKPLFSTSVPWLIGLLMAGIFIADTLTDLEIAVAVFYVVVVLLTAWRFSERGVFVVAVASAALTVLSYVLNDHGALEAGTINSVIGLFAIAATTYLAIKIKRAEDAATAARAQLAHASRLAVLGELAASIAHEINQPLAAVVTNGGACTRWLAMQPPNFAEARQALARMTRDANRASEIIARVRSMASASPAESWLSVNDAIRGVVALLRTELSTNQVAVALDLADDLPAVHADRVQVQQVLVNLVMNAIEAMHDSAAPREILIASALDAPAGAVAVEIHDTGKGLDAGDARRIFDAFYTSKPNGMGLGLSISRTIVEAHGGTISARPASPSGTVFRLTLPAGPAPAGEDAAPFAAARQLQ